MSYNIKIEQYPDGVKIYKYRKPIYTKKQAIETEYQENNKILEEHKEKLKEYEVGNSKTEKEITNSLTSSLNRTKNNIYKLARSNNFDWFVTTTFDPNKLNRTNYLEVSKKQSRYLKDYQQRVEKLKYIFVPEYHKDKKAFHFHGLVSGISLKNLTASINPNNGKLIKDKKGRQVYNWDDYKLGYTTVTSIANSYHPVSWYLSKYITKDVMLKTKNKKRYWRSNNLKEPEILKLSLDTDNLIQAVIDSYKPMYKKNDSQKTINVENKNYKNEITIYDFYND